MNDFRFALRSLAKSPVFTSVAVLSLAIGIGASSAVFSVLNAVRLRSLPVSDPHELRLIHWVGRNAKLSSYSGVGHSRMPGGYIVGSSFPYTAYRLFQDKGHGFSALFALFPLNRLTIVGRSGAETTHGLMVSGNFFSGYGGGTMLGRPLGPEDDRADAAPAIVITHRLWERQYGLDSNVIGQTVSVSRNAFTIVGVLPPTFVGPQLGDPADFYVPFAAQPKLAPNRSLSSSNRWWVQIMGRIAPDGDELKAGAELSVLFSQILGESSTKMDNPSIRIENGAQGAMVVLRNRLSAPLYVMLAVVALVLAIACTNVASLLLARGAVREHEFAVRAAIGASRWRLLRQSFVESIVLGLLSAGIGLLLAKWGTDLLLHGFLNLPADFRIDARTDFNVVGFAIAVSLCTALFFGILPALRAARVDPLGGLKSASAASTPRLRIGRVLAAAQVCLSVLLVVGAGLMIRTFANLRRVDPGFDADNVLLFSVNPSQGGFKAQALASFYEDLRRSIAGFPGVRSVAYTSQALVSDSSESNGVEIPGRPTTPGNAPDTNMLITSEGYLNTLGIPLLQGRDLAESDTASSLPVAVVNETFTRMFFPGENALGRAFMLQDGRNRSFTIVGIARDAKYESIRKPVPPVAYFSYRQHERGALHVAVRSAVPPLSLVPAVRKAVADLSREVPLSEIRTQESYVSHSIAMDRTFAVLCGGVATVALLLACIGLYGLMAYNVSRRKAEIGVRMALGATTRDIAWPVIRDSLMIAIAGITAGVPLAWGAARLIQSQLYGVEAADPLTLVAGGLILVAVAVLAAWLPARRAGRVNPIEALRAE